MRGLLFIFLTALITPSHADDLSKPIFTLQPSDYCKLDAQGKSVGDFKVDKGDSQNAQGAFSWGQGGGCINRPIRDAWGVTHNQPVMVWDGVTTSQFAPLAAIPGSTHVYEVQYTVKDFITVHWTMDWVHAVLDGTIAAPKHIIVNYRKVAGTTYIPYWEGTLDLQELAPGVTAFAMRNQVNASQTSSDDAASTVQGVFDHLTKADPNMGPITQLK